MAVKPKNNQQPKLLRQCDIRVLKGLSLNIIRIKISRKLNMINMDEFRSFSNLYNWSFYDTSTQTATISYQRLISPYGTNSGLHPIYSRLSLSRSRRDPLKHFEISVLRHIRFAELRKIPTELPNFTNEHVILLL